MSSSEVAESSEAAAAPQQQQQQEGAAPARPSGWQILRSILFQMVIFYLITSFFRRQSPPTAPDGTPIKDAQNLFPSGQEMVDPY